MRERFYLHGWNLADDDNPNFPEYNPLDSAQRRRYLKSVESIGRHKNMDGININVQTPPTGI